MPPLPVLDLDHPQVRVIPALAGDIGVQFAFAVGCDGLDPQAVAVGAEGFGEQAGGAGGGVVGLDDDRAGAGVAGLDHGGIGALDLGAADQGADPQVAGKKQFANPARTRNPNPGALGSGHEDRPFPPASQRFRVGHADRRDARRRLRRAAGPLL